MNTQEKFDYIIYRYFFTKGKKFDANETKAFFDEEFCEFFSQNAEKNNNVLLELLDFFDMKILMVV